MPAPGRRVLGAVPESVPGLKVMGPVPMTGLELGMP